MAYLVGTMRPNLMEDPRMTDAGVGAASAAAATEGPWQDPGQPVAERVADLMARMTLREKIGQLAGFWAAPPKEGEPVAPMQDDFGAEGPSLEEAAADGLGHLTRVFGTAPLSPQEGNATLRALQDTVTGSNRFGIPAIAHEECLTGLAAQGATIFPIPLAWGASFDPGLVERSAAAIGSTLRRLGVHQGLAPVLDVTRDYRWGRTEETIGEDPYLVGVVGAAYVRGLESSGVVATLKHFAGYSASRGARNMAPAALGPRELRDVIIEPFVLALREGKARSVMHSYADLDGVPSAGDQRLLTDLLRGQLGFDGVLVADYFGVSFLQTLHRVADSPGAAAYLALRAGVDVELPTVRCYGEPLVDLAQEGGVPQAWIDRAVARVLRLKCELGLLDPGPAVPEAAEAAEADLDPPEHRDLARRLAEQSVVLLDNDGTLPLDAGERRVALVGPRAQDPLAMLGCYSFPVHVGRHHPDKPLGVRIPTLHEALEAELPGTLTVAPGCPVTDEGPAADTDRSIAEAVAAAREADLCVLALGDRSGMFGSGTSGEGCDAESLALPGRQAELAQAVLDTGTPTVVVLLTGRPYALGPIADRAAAVLQAFFPGQEGAGAVAGIISGRLSPSGRLPVGIPRTPGGPATTYLRSRLAGPSDVSSVDPTHRYPFGHGLTWTRFDHTDLIVTAGPEGSTDAVPTDGTVTVSSTVTNTGTRAGTEVVQLYLADPAASVVQPERRLTGWARLHLEPGESARVHFTVHADRTSFTGADLTRIVEPGRIEVLVGRSSADLPLQGAFTLAGPVRVLGRDRVLTVPVRVQTTSSMTTP